MLTAPPSPLNSDDTFLCEFHTIDHRIVAVCPLYVVGVEQTGSGVAIRTARGSVADMFNVTGVSTREVIDRLRASFRAMHESFLSAFLRNDVGAMEDRVIGRLMSKIGDANAASVQEMKAGLRTLVRSEVAEMAALDAPPEPEKPASRKGR